MMLIFFAVYHSVDHFLARQRTKNCLRIMASVGWLTYVVVEVYYEGAMTMFFTTKNNLPFETIEVVF